MKKDTQIINREYANLLKEFLIERFCNWCGFDRKEELEIIFPQKDGSIAGLNIEVLINELLRYLLYEQG